MCKHAAGEISIFSLVSVAEETGSKLTLSDNPKTGFLVTRPIYILQNDPLPPEVTSSGGALDINNLNETRAGRYTCMTVGPQGNILTSSTLVTITDSK